jgi:EAL domain-containing protein (putative c-di-GMP-specific phosphodiesterase class I)
VGQGFYFGKPQPAEAIDAEEAEQLVKQAKKKTA